VDGGDDGKNMGVSPLIFPKGVSGGVELSAEPENEGDSNSGSFS
jgi:hypothetical protein